MALLAIISGPAHDVVPDRTIAGLTLVQRLVRQLVKLRRIEHIWIDTATIRPGMDRAILDESTAQTRVLLFSRIRNATISNEDTCLVFDSRSLIDDRILEWISSEQIAATCVHERAHQPSSDSSDWHPRIVLGNSLLNACIQDAAGTDVVKVLRATGVQPALDGIPTYMENRRRVVPLLLLHITNDEDGRQGVQALVDAAQKGVLDWPAWYIHRPIENSLALALSRLPVTPNQITLLTGVLGFIATVFFIQGRFLEALLIALGVGVLDGVDGKLARLRLMTTKVGELEHVLDKVVEYSWYGAMAYFLSETHSNSAPLIMAVGLVLFLIADEIQCEFFRRMSGKQICDASPFDRAFRLIGGRRNTHMWVLMPFVISGNNIEGFAVICAYGVGTFFVHQARFVINTRRVLEESSTFLRENFKRTKVI